MQFFYRNGNANFRNYCIASTIWETKTIKWLASTKKKRLFVCLLLLFDEEVDDGKTNAEPRNKTWIWPWLPRRMERGLYHQLFQELAVENTCSFQEFMRMDKECFFLRWIEKSFLPVFLASTYQWCSSREGIVNHHLNL